MPPNWVSEASPTLGCSILIYMSVCRNVGMYVGLSTKICMSKCVGGITHTHAQSQLWAVKTNL